MRFVENLVFFSIAFIIFNHGIEGRSFDSEDSAVENKLKLLNKPALKSIQSEDGDIIDCVDINKQPAFDHPLLKNHKIQMEPSNGYPKGINMEAFPNKVSQIWQRNGTCPMGTVPIRRTRKEDLLRATSLSRFGMKDPISSVYPPNATKESDGGRVFDSNGKLAHYYSTALADINRYFGAFAIINVWNPPVEASDYSAADVSLLTPSTVGENYIVAGWNVYPQLFGDHSTRLFTQWTADGNQKTGCLNLLCPGFVQVSKDITLGAALQPVSTLLGGQYDIVVSIYMDQKTGNWWFQYHDTHVGYYPGDLFPSLKESATMVEWGGDVMTIDKGGPMTTTGMGAGDFPGIFGTASYFKNIQIVDNSNVFKKPRFIYHYADHPSCYSIHMYGDPPSHDPGVYFYFGGPGRSPRCP